MNQFVTFTIGFLGLTALFVTGYMIGELEGGNALLLWITSNMVMSMLLNNNKLF